MFKIATWNVNSLRVRLPQVLDWLSIEKPDVLALQEIKLTNEDFPLEAIRQAGYQAIFSGQKAYNGVALLSRETLIDPVTDIPDLQDPQRRILGATLGDVRIINLYVPNGESVGSDKYHYKLNWLQHVRNFLAAELTRYEKVVVVGDANIAPEDIDVHDPKLWEGRILCSELERGSLQEILKLGFKDCFRLHTQAEKSFSWWDYRLNAFKRNLGLRIDLILASEKIAMECRQCRIDTTPRTHERPSDHAIVIAEF